MRVHSVLPHRLTEAVDAVLREAGIEHVAHGDAEPVAAAATAGADPEAAAIIGPYRSADVVEAVASTGVTGLPMLAPAATWAGITRDDEPGCGDPADSRGFLFRLVARDTVVAERIAAEARAAGTKALVIAGRHDYGRQLDAQLRLAGLPRASAPADADLVVLCGLAGEPEVERAALIDLPLVAFDGVQGSDLGDREVFLALPYAPVDGLPHEDVLAGAGSARRAAELVVAALHDGATNRTMVFVGIDEHGSFDDFGDPADPEVSLWRAGPDWVLEPHRPLVG